MARECTPSPPTARPAECWDISSHTARSPLLPRSRGLNRGPSKIPVRHGTDTAAILDRVQERGVRKVSEQQQAAAMSDARVCRKFNALPKRLELAEKQAVAVMRRRTQAWARWHQGLAVQRKQGRLRHEATERVQRHMRGYLVRRAAAVTRAAKEMEAAAHEAGVARSTVEAAGERAQLAEQLLARFERELRWDQNTVSATDELLARGKFDKAVRACDKAAEKACQARQQVGASAPMRSAVDALLNRVSSIRERIVSCLTRLDMQCNTRRADEAVALQRGRVAMEKGDFDQWRRAVGSAHGKYASEETTTESVLVKLAHESPDRLEEVSRVLRLAEDNPRAALNVSQHAPKSAVRKAYRRLALRLHPDKNPGQEPLYEAAFKALQSANEAITRRASYQAHL